MFSDLCNVNEHRYANVHSDIVVLSDDSVKNVDSSEVRSLQAILSGKPIEDAFHILNADQSNELPDSACVRLLMEYKDYSENIENMYYNGSGFFINQTMIMIAGHNLYSQNNAASNVCYYKQSLDSTEFKLDVLGYDIMKPINSWLLTKKIIFGIDITESIYVLLNYINDYYLIKYEKFKLESFRLNYYYIHPKWMENEKHDIALLFADHPQNNFLKLSTSHTLGKIRTSSCPRGRYKSVSYGEATEYNNIMPYSRYRIRKQWMCYNMLAGDHSVVGVHAYNRGKLNFGTSIKYNMPFINNGIRNRYLMTFCDKAFNDFANPNYILSAI
ncbi:hypothetical protein [Candidatus Cytomitobacter primus]|uniref:Uncharacterized protein n=2 Tax=Candidatus Cytomitobacter primus TaxID=2066024 RepID=A0A5C0UG63_9PROT|nr:hypothetical protein [Candidatus Cytomitobacter primus]QEK38671.1 hypothetical protein FZC34_01995 [Candidatus Cytomitobacter primus]